MSSEWWMLARHLKHHAPQSPNVHLKVIGFHQDQLRCFVQGRATFIHLAEASVRLEILSEAEISKLDCFIFHEKYVVGFDIHMQDISIV